MTGYRVLASLVVQTVKLVPAKRENRVRSLGREDPLEKEMATHSSTLAWKIPWTEEPGRLRSMGSQKVGHDWVTSLSAIMKLRKQKNNLLAGKRSSNSKDNKSVVNISGSVSKVKISLKHFLELFCRIQTSLAPKQLESKWWSYWPLLTSMTLIN